jgi:hypothetical protein
MFIFSCVIVLYFICVGRIYIPNCCRSVKDTVNYGIIDNWKDRYNNYVNRYELSSMGLKKIKDELLKRININGDDADNSYNSYNSWFSISESILTMEIEDFNANTISDLLVEYKNVQEWISSDLGDVLYILKTTPLKTTRAYMRNIRCFHILLDEFVYYLYKNLCSNEIKSRFGHDYIYLNSLVSFYGISRGECTYELQTNFDGDTDSDDDGDDSDSDTDSDSDIDA